jgi:hypothetical protein
MAEKHRDPSPSVTLTNDKPSIDHTDHKLSSVDKADALEAQNAIDPAIDARVTRKCDLHIIPWLFGIWLLAFIDRTTTDPAPLTYP